jgi:hypothetical protein
MLILAFAVRVFSANRIRPNQNESSTMPAHTHTQRLKSTSLKMLGATKQASSLYLSQRIPMNLTMGILPAEKQGGICRAPSWDVATFRLRSFQQDWPDASLWELPSLGGAGAGMAAGERRFAGEWAEPVELEVAPLPCWESWGEEERQREVRALLREVEAEARAQGTPVLGRGLCRHSTRIPGPSDSIAARDHWDMRQRARPCGSCVSSTVLSSRCSEKLRLAGGRGIFRRALLEFFDTLSGDTLSSAIPIGGGTP